jgi:hypothetical protein
MFQDDMLHMFGIVNRAREGFAQRTQEGEMATTLMVMFLLSVVFLLLTSWLSAALWNLTMVPLAGFKKATLYHGLLLKALLVALLL